MLKNITAIIRNFIFTLFLVFSVFCSLCSLLSVLYLVSDGGIKWAKVFCSPPLPTVKQDDAYFALKTKTVILKI